MIPQCVMDISDGRLWSVMGLDVWAIARIHVYVGEGLQLGHCCTCFSIYEIARVVHNVGIGRRNSFKARNYPLLRSDRFLFSASDQSTITTQRAASS